MPAPRPLSPLQPAGSHARRRRHGRGRRLAGRGLPLVLLAAAAFAGGAVTGTRHMPQERTVVERFVAAWSRGDYAAMHAELAPSSQRRWPLRRFTREYRRAAGVATVQRVRPREPLRRISEGRLEAAVTVSTKVFGTRQGTITFSVRTEEEDAGIVWARHLVFPGLRRGETLRRNVTMPPRAELQSRDGRTLAAGEDRSSTELGPLAAEVAGLVGPIPEERAAEYQAKGYPPDAMVGLTGLERELESRLAGTFGGLLRAGGRVIARAEPRRAKAVRTSIDPEVQQAAVTALAGRLGGIAVVRPRTGEVLALAGIAYSAPQPPGSVFKIVTLAGALEAKTLKADESFPIETAATLEGVEIENANKESCGGSLANSFAHSCNSVFAPVGAELGARRLVEAAERFGFNEDPEIQGAQPSTIPAASEIGDDLAVGSSAIGQGRVLITPLHLATIGGAIANRGMLVRPTLLRGDRGRRTRATTSRVARIIDRFMRLVVTDGTGGAARIAGVTVAGKTGTAELRDSTPEPEATVEPGVTPPPAEDDRTDTDAWFVAYAPAGKPRVAVAVLLVGQGAGGETAAPAAREVLVSALKDGP